MQCCVGWEGSTESSSRWRLTATDNERSVWVGHATTAGMDQVALFYSSFFGLIPPAWSAFLLSARSLHFWGLGAWASEPGQWVGFHGAGCAGWAG